MASEDVGFNATMNYILNKFHITVQANRALL
jgi:hypothetical protein